MPAEAATAAASQIYHIRSHTDQTNKARGSGVIQTILGFLAGLIERTLGGLRSAGGVTTVTPEMRELAGKVAALVRPQLADLGASHLQQLTLMRSFALGYVATLADEAVSGSKAVPQSRGARIVVTLLAISSLDDPRRAGEGVDHLMSELEGLEEARDYGYGQGGAVALQDVPVINSGQTARGLFTELKGMRIAPV